MLQKILLAKLLEAYLMAQDPGDDLAFVAELRDVDGKASIIVRSVVQYLFPDGAYTPRQSNFVLQLTC